MYFRIREIVPKASTQGFHAKGLDSIPVTAWSTNTTGSIEQKLAPETASIPPSKLVLYRKVPTTIYVDTLCFNHTQCSPVYLSPT